MKYPRVAWSLLPALVGGLVIAFGLGDGPVGLADETGFTIEYDERYVEAHTDDVSDEEYSHEYDDTDETSFTIEYDERYAEAHTDDASDE